VFKSPKEQLVRFSDFHPAHNPEGYFYNMLLQHVIVRDEAALLSANNPDGTYFTECKLRKFITSDEVNMHLPYSQLPYTKSSHIRSCHTRKAAIFAAAIFAAAIHEKLPYLQLPYLQLLYTKSGHI
jgi:hypothetical protein